MDRFIPSKAENASRKMSMMPIRMPAILDLTAVTKSKSCPPTATSLRKLQAIPQRIIINPADYEDSPDRTIKFKKQEKVIRKQLFKAPRTKGPNSNLKNKLSSKIVKQSIQSSDVNDTIPLLNIDEIEEVLIKSGHNVVNKKLKKIIPQKLRKFKENIPTNSNSKLPPISTYELNSTSNFELLENVCGVQPSKAKQTGSFLLNDLNNENKDVKEILNNLKHNQEMFDKQCEQFKIAQTRNITKLLAIANSEKLAKSTCLVNNKTPISSVQKHVRFTTPDKTNGKAIKTYNSMRKTFPILITPKVLKSKNNIKSPSVLATDNFTTTCDTPINKYRLKC